MSTTSQFSSEGTLLWKTKFVYPGLTNSNVLLNIFTDLKDCNIMSDINISMKVQYQGETLVHIFLNNIVSWEREGIIINLFTKDHIMYQFSFQTIVFAKSADDRINQLVNGIILEGCESITANPDFNDDFNDDFLI